MNKLVEDFVEYWKQVGLEVGEENYYDREVVSDQAHQWLYEQGVRDHKERMKVVDMIFEKVGV